MKVQELRALLKGRTAIERNKNTLVVHYYAHLGKETKANSAPGLSKFFLKPVLTAFRTKL